MRLKLWRYYRQYTDQAGMVHAVKDWTVVFTGVPFSALCGHTEYMQQGGELTVQSACPGCDAEIQRQILPTAPVVDGRKTNQPTKIVPTGDYL